MARRRRSYTDQERAAAIALYAEAGPTVVQDQLGVPKATVTAWAQQAGVGTVRNEQTAAAVQAAKLDRELTREHLRDEMLTKALALLERMDQPHIDFKGKDASEVVYPLPSPSGCQAYATAAAILLDKFRLEVGEATERHERIDGERVGELRDELARRRAARAA